MWERFDSYLRDTDHREQLNVGELTKAMLDGALVLASGGTLGEAAQLLFERTNTLRVFATDARGEQDEPSIAAPHTVASPPLAPLLQDVHCNWSRREYFRNAISVPGRVAVAGPHYSMIDGRLCYTGAIAIETPGGTRVLCADFPFASESDPAPA
jgi:hypothetical protein